MVKENVFKFKSLLDTHVDLCVAKLHLTELQKEASFKSFEESCAGLTDTTKSDINDLGIDMGPTRRDDDQEKASKKNVIFFTRSI